MKERWTIKEGDTFDLLTVKYLVGSVVYSGKTRRLYKCVCQCGNEVEIVSDKLKLETKSPKSCGCHVKESFWKDTELERNSWASMFVRCYNPVCKSYPSYGGRGITICDRWNPDFGGSFVNFFDDLGKRPSKEYTVDRIDVNGNYEPDNCKWATRTEQEVNKRMRTKNTSGKTGVYFYKKYGKWEVKISHNKKQLYIGMFEDFEDAVKARQEAEIKYYGGIIGH